MMVSIKFNVVAITKHPAYVFDPPHTFDDTETSRHTFASGIFRNLELFNVEER